MKKHEKQKKRKLQDSKLTLDGIVLPADDFIIDKCSHLVKTTSLRVY